MVRFETLVEESLRVPFCGWDFSVLGARISLEPPPWSFEELVDIEATRADSMLDLGTGGGEWLSARHRARRTVATESWLPNLSVAWSRLARLGVAVVHTEGATDNAQQRECNPSGRLAFRDGAFDLVVSRHESFVASELARVLRSGGVFITQQAGAGGESFDALLGLGPAPDDDFHPDLAVAQLQVARFQIEDAAVGSATTVFADVGALVWYLTNVPWAVNDFSIERCQDALTRLHDTGPIRVTAERFWIRARG